MLGGKHDKFVIHRFHHMEFWCQDATSAYKRFQHGVGMNLVAKSDHSTGNKTCASYVLQSNAMVFAFTAPYAPETDADDSVNPIPGYSAAQSFKFICKHGLAVRSVGILVADAKLAYETAMENGAEGVLEPTTLKDKASGTSQVVSEVRAYGPGQGDVVFRFVSGDFRGPLLAGYEKVVSSEEPTYGVRRIDHIGSNVPDMKKTCNYLGAIMGLHKFAGFTTKDVGTERSGMNSTVMACDNQMVLQGINEPTHGTIQKSQIQTYLEQNVGPGVQHIALKSDNIFQTLREMKSRSGRGGFEFVPPPGENYYKVIPEEWKRMLTEEDFKLCKELGVLIDKDRGGLLLQIFTKPLGDRPTVFLEIIQRIGDTIEVIDEFGNKVTEQSGACGGFGKGNFGELFKRLEEYERQLGISSTD